MRSLSDWHYVVDAVQVQSQVFMLSSSDFHYVVRYCAGSVVGMYGVVVRLALAGPIHVWFRRMSL